ncbi:MAG: AMP-binding protein [Bacteroidia bacterium]|nr:AMP-binding protein [Bacteroidia bacterium]
MLYPSDKIALRAENGNVTYKQLLSRAKTFSATIANQEKVLILSENRPAWAYAVFGIWQAGAITVPVDATSTATDIAYIIDDCKPESMFVSEGRTSLAQEALAIASHKPTIINIDNIEAEAISKENSTTAEEFKYDQERVALIVYTSGTTGSPKGVMLTFDNMMANIGAVSEEVKIFRKDLITMALLPLHHILPLLGTLVAPLVTEGSIAFCPSMAAGDLMKTLKDHKVNMIIGVPRLYATLVKGIMDKINASAAGRIMYKLCEKLQCAWLSKAIFGEVHKKMGGHIEYLVSGGAALDAEIAKTLKTLGFNLLEGYGMTEASPIIAFTRPHKLVPGSAGQPMPSVQVEIRDGEICAKGRNIMKGYYNRPEETAQILKDGWLYTGDLGYLDDKQRLFITGRRKEIIVLSNGKNVNPHEIEYKIENYAAMVKECGIMPNADLLHAIIVPADALAASLTDDQIREKIKWEVIEPYNKDVAPYKKVMSFSIYRGDLPRTKLEKLQRFRLPQILEEIENANNANKPVEKKADSDESLSKEYCIIRDYIQEEKHCKVSPEKHIEMDLAFDSLDKVGLQVFLQNTFGLEVSTEQIAQFASVGTMAAWVAESKTRIEVEKVDWAQILKQHAKVRLPQTWATGNLFVTLTKPLFKLYFKLSSKGADNIPEDGPVIYAPNHQSFLDGLFVMSFLKWRSIKNTYFYAKQEHVRRPITKFIANHHNVIVLDMNNIKDSIQKLGEALKKKKNIIIFPEGTRTMDGKLGEFKKTFAILSKELGVPVVPVSIKGAFEAMPKGSIFPRPRPVKVEFLKPIYPNSHSYQDLTNEVCRKIKENLSI